MKSVLWFVLSYTVLAVLPVWAACPSADLTGDCSVNLKDYSILAGWWLAECDAANDGCDGADMDSSGNVNIADLNEWFAQWFDEGTPESEGMVWVAVTDAGVTGYGGFSGQMSKYETTNAQYCQFLNSALAAGLITVHNNIVYAADDTDYARPYFKTYAANSGSQVIYSDNTFSVRTRDGYSMATHPVVMVSWYGATAFCDYYEYRLPTEWEWQAVADYNGTYAYACGSSISPNKANYYNNGSYANPLGLTSTPYTSPVGYYQEYGYGLCDMTGNVFEWTSTADGSNRVLRGGAWNSLVSVCGVSYRYDATPSNTANYRGFRVCR